MRGNVAITVRIPVEIKRRIQVRARQERRSLSAQVAHELEAALAGAAVPPPAQPGRFLGLFRGARVPSDLDFREIRGLLWGGLARRATGR